MKLSSFKSNKPKILKDRPKAKFATEDSNNSTKFNKPTVDSSNKVKSSTRKSKSSKSNKEEYTTPSKRFDFIVESPKYPNAFFIDVRATDFEKAKEILEKQFPNSEYYDIDVAGTLLEYNDTYRKNLKPKYND